MHLLGISTNIHGYPFLSMDIHGLSISRNRGYPWISMDIHLLICEMDIHTKWISIDILATRNHACNVQCSFEMDNKNYKCIMFHNAVFPRPTSTFDSISGHEIWNVPHLLLLVLLIGCCSMLICEPLKGCLVRLQFQGQVMWYHVIEHNKVAVHANPLT